MKEPTLHYQQGDRQLSVQRDWCKGCNLCVENCPSHILSLDDGERIVVGDISRCIFCGICAVRCPDFVFTLERVASPALAMGGTA